jgi:hypothetical protein
MVGNTDFNRQAEKVSKQRHNFLVIWIWAITYMRVGKSSLHAVTNETQQTGSLAELFS